MQNDIAQLVALLVALFMLGLGIAFMLGPKYAHKYANWFFKKFTDFLAWIAALLPRMLHWAGRWLFKKLSTPKPKQKKKKKKYYARRK